MRIPLLSSPSRFILALGLLAAAGVGCIGGSDAASGQAGGEAGVGPFMALDVDIEEGAVWPINGLVRIEFNRAVDPDSIGFSSIQFSPERRDAGCRSAR